MSTHNICFHAEIRKISTIFGQKKKVPYLELCIRFDRMVFTVCALVGIIYKQIKGNFRRYSKLQISCIFQPK